LPTSSEEIAIVPLHVLGTTAHSDSPPSEQRTIKSGGALEPQTSDLDDLSLVSLSTPIDEGGTSADFGHVLEHQDHEDNSNGDQETDGQPSESPEPLPTAPPPPHLPRRSSRHYKPIKIFSAMAKGVKSVPVVAHTFLAGMDYSMDDSEPHGYREAMASPEREKWLTGMKEEVKLLNEMETWRLVKPPPGRKVLTGV
jgi:hypothetical protein